MVRDRVRVRIGHSPLPTPSLPPVDTSCGVDRREDIDRVSVEPSEALANILQNEPTRVFMGQREVCPVCLDEFGKRCTRPSSHLVCT